MVETRAIKTLLPVLFNFLANLPDEWRFQLFLSEVNEPLIFNNTKLNGLCKQGRITIHRAPNITTYPTDYNKLLQSRWFWNLLAGENILIFQPDSVLCSRSPHHINEYLEYDYVGAPWAGEAGWSCGNGGLSLRSKSKTLQVLNTTTPDASIYEDRWHCTAIVKLGGKLPPREIDKTFSVETLFYDRPLGVHKFYAHMPKEAQEKLFAFCPEAKMLI